MIYDFSVSSVLLKLNFDFNATKIRHGSNVTAPKVTLLFFLLNFVKQPLTLSGTAVTPVDSLSGYRMSLFVHQRVHSWAQPVEKNLFYEITILLLGMGGQNHNDLPEVILPSKCKIL